MFSEKETKKIECISYDGSKKALLHSQEVDLETLVVEDAEEESVEDDEYEKNLLPRKARNCTDKFFIILLLLSWAAMIVIGLSSIGRINTYSYTHLRKGNPLLLTHGVDYEGNICGTGINKDLPNSYFPNFSGSNPDSKSTYVPPLLSICLAKCPQEGDTIVDPYSTYGSWTAE